MLPFLYREGLVGAVSNRAAAWNLPMLPFPYREGLLLSARIQSAPTEP